MAAILCSDERANPLGQEAQIVTRLLETYRWGIKNFDQFGRSYFPTVDAYRQYFEKVLLEFQESVSREMSSGGVLVLKNPELSLVVKEVAEVMPSAPIVAMMRDPRDQISSELEVISRRAPNTHTTSAQRSANIKRLTASYISYYTPLLAAQEQFTHHISMVRYEDLVKSTDEVVQSLAAKLKLKPTFRQNAPWPRVAQLAALQSTPSRSPLYGQPIASNSIDRYRRDLSDDEAEYIMSKCAEIMYAFDYR